jgi:hypothetical protein
LRARCRPIVTLIAQPFFLQGSVRPGRPCQTVKGGGQSGTPASRGLWNLHALSQIDADKARYEVQEDHEPTLGNLSDGAVSTSLESSNVAS